MYCQKGRPASKPSTVSKITFICFEILKKYRLEIFVFLLSLTVSLGLFLRLFMLYEESFMISYDSPGYIQLAKNIVCCKVFSEVGKL